MVIYYMIVRLTNLRNLPLFNLIFVLVVFNNKLHGILVQEMQPETSN